MAVVVVLVVLVVSPENDTQKATPTLGGRLAVRLVVATRPNAVLRSPVGVAVGVCFGVPCLIAGLLPGDQAVVGTVWPSSSVSHEEVDDTVSTLVLVIPSIGA